MAFCADAEQQGLLSLGLWYGQHQEQLKHREELSSNTAKDWFGHVMWFGVTFDGVGELREKKGCPATLQPLAGTSHTTPSSVTAGWWFGSLN